MVDDPILVTEDADGILLISLNRPGRRNAFDEPMAAELGTLFSGRCTGPHIRMVILEGAGPDFCAGFDIGSRGRLDPSSAMTMMASMFHSLAAIPVPTAAIVRGATMGGGVGLAAACDMVVASRDAYFACPEGRHGLLPAIMMPYLLRAIGPRHALFMLTTGSRIGAETALRWGLVDELVDGSEALGVRRDAIAGDVLRCGPMMARSVKPLVMTLSGKPIDEALIARTVKAAVESRASADVREGFAAFREKREPAWVPEGARKPRP